MFSLLLFAGESTVMNALNWRTLLHSSLYHALVFAHSFGFPDDTSGKEPACKCRRHKRSGWIPGYGRFPGEGMATHSSLLAWGILWTEVPSGLWSEGSQRVRHNWRDLACTHTHISAQTY